MAKINTHALRRDRANQIEKLRRVLEKHRICHDLSPIGDAIKTCQIRPKEGENYWGYTVRPLKFGKIENLQHTKPANAENLQLTLTSKIVGKCCHEEEVTDPFEDLKLNILIEGEDPFDKKLSCCWHLDKHLSNEGDNEPEFAHPRYHFHYGGEEIWNRIAEQNYDFGASLIIEPPRISHPPLEIVLAVDFVLSNFYGETWKRLLRETEYKKCVKEAQERFWKPYAFTVASQWTTLLSSNWQAQDIWPQLIS